MWEKVCKENIRDKIYPRPNYQQQQTGDTNLFRREDAFEGYRPIQSFREDVEEKKKKRKTNLISFIITELGGKTKRKESFFFWYVLPRGRLITVNIIQVIIFLNRLEEDKQHQKAERKENTPKGFARVLFCFPFVCWTFPTFSSVSAESTGVNNKSLLIYCRVYI